MVQGGRRLPVANIRIVGSTGLNGESQELAVPPNFVKGLTHEMFAEGAGNNVTIELFDPTWTILDLFITQGVLASSGKGTLKVKYEYGYHDELSITREVAVHTFTPGKLDHLGAHVTLEGTDTGVWDALTQESQIDAKAIYNDTPSDIAAEIARSRDWQINVEPAAPLFNPATGQFRQFVRGNQNDLQFLKAIAKHAHSFRVPGPYRVRVETNENGRTQLYFAPDGVFDLNQIFKSYNLGHDNRGEVRDFDVTLNSLGFAAYGGGGLNGITIDPSTREPVTVNVKPDGDIGARRLGRQVFAIPGRNINQILDPQTQDTAERATRAFYARMAELVNEATLTVDGDVNIRPQHLINLLVQTPLGQRYFTSGVWRVIKLTNQVQPGDFSTELELVRNAADQALLDGTGPQITAQTFAGPGERSFDLTR